MTKPVSERQTQSLLLAGIALLSTAIFVGDLTQPLGIVVWVLYALPVAASFFALRPSLPFAVAAIASVLIVAGYYLEVDTLVVREIARINRTFGIVTLWILATAGHFFIRNKLAIREQRWLQDGQVGLSQAMGGEQPLATLGESVLTFLAPYVGAQAGALFIRDGGEYRRHGTYGVPADSGVPERFAAGDGLLGQAAKEGRSFRLADVPERDLVYGSGLSRGRPHEILIAPMQVDGETNAVIELGFVGRAADVHAELLRNMSESIAVAVRSARYRVRLQELLEETQRQAEELQAQSDELKASNEELEEQARALQESRSRLELQQSELEETNAQLEEQTRLLEVQRDDLSRAQASLQAQARELEQASRYKSEFVANMSHELRTPLNSLLIMARLLADNRDGTLTEDQVRYATTIEASGNDLLALINDILDISKIESGRVELQVGTVRVGAMARKLVETFRPQATAKGIAIDAEISPDMPAEIETDGQRLEQILKNFLANAVKFTDTGSVTLLAGRTVDGRLAFTVRDTGIGIPADKQEAIFEPFRQADGTIDRKYGGTGLGLSISRELTRLLGGEIRVDSAVGRGSSFSLIVPERFEANSTPAQAIVRRQPVPERPPVVQPASPPAFRSRPFVDDRDRLDGSSRVLLVVEDDAKFARILYDLARELGFQCVTADTADEGLTLAREVSPDAVILDVGLPDHSGLSVLERLKRDLGTRHIPVHVVSVADYTDTALAFGAAGYMLKPVSRERLVQALEGLERRWAQSLRRVLIVEDDARQLESLELLLKSRDVETSGADTVAAAMERLKATTFDCMVLDLSLPDASGFELLERMSSDEEFAFPPVIVYTGRDLSLDEELRLRRYSRSVIIKGAKSHERLLDEVTLFLHQVVSELPEQQQKMLARALNRDSVLEGRRILVVEDDVRNIFSLTSVFEPHGVEVVIARNGREALEALERAAGSKDQAIDLVLMDVMMPEMDGLTATREIRKRREWRDLPIITLTAKAMRDDHDQCLAAGANDYLAKPLDVDKLLSLVRVWMPR